MNNKSKIKIYVPAVVTISLLFGLFYINQTSVYESRVPLHIMVAENSPQSDTGLETKQEPQQLTLSAKNIEQFQVLLFLEQSKKVLKEQFEKLLPRADFAMMPAKMLNSFLAKRCIKLRHQEQNHPKMKAFYPKNLQNSEDLCRSLVFGIIQQKTQLADQLDSAQFWGLLQQIDEVFSDSFIANNIELNQASLNAGYQAFQTTRKLILGENLDQHLFGLSDDVFYLPSMVTEISLLSDVTLAEKIALFDAHIRQIERHHNITSTDILEPIEFAKMEIRIYQATLQENTSLEGSSELLAEFKESAMAKYMGHLKAEQYLTYQKEESLRITRLNQFNLEREDMLDQARIEGISEEQLPLRMQSIDKQLFKKYLL